VIHRPAVALEYLSPALENDIQTCESKDVCRVLWKGWCWRHFFIVSLWI